ncbi:uncharacterized protein UTRI_00977 [Ustilago trichophora]|uniref:Uncharacterized protein n=1 Tax=Ustilago trichophora TaxID=86804 RepID=A0A5C3DYV0_9BASI|nr:uncharacterized protein UTRI_00977 [Ustilago trichophora]
MDSDPFAVWEDPAPASTASITSKTLQPDDGSTATDIKKDARLSLEYEDEDPGWGVASASTSRANSPEKTRKQVPARPPSADVSPILEAKTLAKAEAPVSSIDEEARKPSATEPASDETVATAVTSLKEETATPQDTEPNKGTSIDDTRPKTVAGDELGDGMDTFQDLRQDQAEQVEDETIADEFAQKATVAPSAEASQEDDGFDDFDDPSGVTDQGGAAHDDFGDFDDFETGDTQNDADFGDDDFGDDGFEEPAAVAEQAAPVVAAQPAPSPVPTRTWSPLDVTSRSTRNNLADSVRALLPLSTAAEQHLTTAALRQVEGPSQVLVSPESRQLLADLSSFPSVRPIDWVRSKTRRDYLISMGVPVNLDEIHSSFASGSGGSRQLPPLQLKYDSSANRASGSADANGNGLQRSSSLKLAGTGSGQAATAQRSASTSNSPRNGSQSPALGSSTNRERIAERRMQELGLGPAPQVDLRRAEELVNKTEDQLTLLSLPALKSILRELNTLTTSTSSLLTHHLTLRESYQADSEMYNSMIKELVTGAASRFSGGGSVGSNSVAGGRGDSRRSTTMGMSVSSSGKGRVSSLPAGSTAMSGTRSMSPSLRGGAATSPRR